MTSTYDKQTALAHAQHRATRDSRPIGVYHTPCGKVWYVQPLPLTLDREWDELVLFRVVDP